MSPTETIRGRSHLSESASKIEKKKRLAVAYTKRNLKRRRISLSQLNSSMSKIGIHISDINDDDQLYRGVRELQSKLRIKIDGRYGTETNKALNKALSLVDSIENRENLQDVLSSDKYRLRLNYLLKKSFVRARYSRRMLKRYKIDKTDFVKDLVKMGMKNFNFDDDESLVKAIFFLQKKLGFKVYKIDSEFGPKTHRAYSKYRIVMGVRGSTAEIARLPKARKVDKGQVKPRRSVGSPEKRRSRTLDKRNPAESVVFLGNADLPQEALGMMSKIDKLAKKYGLAPGHVESSDIYVLGNDGKYHLNIYGLKEFLYVLLERNRSNGREEKVSVISSDIKKLSDLVQNLKRYYFPSYEHHFKKYLRSSKKSYAEKRREFKMLRKKVRSGSENSTHAIARMRAKCLKRIGMNGSRYGLNPLGFDNVRAFVFDPARGPFYNARIRDFYSRGCNLKLVVYRKKYLKLAKKFDNHEDLYLNAIPLILDQKTGEFVDSKGRRVAIYRGDVVAEYVIAARNKMERVDGSKDKVTAMTASLSRVGKYLKDKLFLPIKVDKGRIEFSDEKDGFEMKVKYGDRLLTFSFNLKELVDFGVVHPPTDDINRIYRIDLSLFAEIIYRKYYSVFYEAELRNMNRKKVESIDPSKGAVICGIGTHARTTRERYFADEKDKMLAFLRKKYQSKDVLTHRGTGISRPAFLRLLRDSVNICLKKNKDLIFYYSGHSSKENDKMYLWAASAGGAHTNGVRPQEIFDILRPLLNRGRRVTMIADGCKTGYLGRTFRHRNMTVLAAARPGQLSGFDSSGSDFTRTLLAVMRKNPKITLGKAFLQSEDEVMNQSSNTSRRDSRSFQEIQLYSEGRLLADVGRGSNERAV